MTGRPDAAYPFDARTAELAANVTGVLDRVRRACDACGRDPAGVTIIAVTKFFPASDVRRLAALGIHDMGENRDQEASAKYADVRADTPGIRLHFIGQLQTNKARSVARYADVVHTVDRPSLVSALTRGAQLAGRGLDVLVQVNLDPGAAGRGGAEPDDLPQLMSAVRASGVLRLRGVMAVAPLQEDPDEVFGRLAGIAEGVRALVPEATWLSAGMSADMEAAIRHGATHLRVGTAILGSRPPLR
jgi:pyridoxal phosphate enzyme (YggS family)